MKNRVLVPILAILIVLSCGSQGSCLVEETHRAINEYIAQTSINGFSLKEYLINNLGLAKGVDEIIGEKWVGENGCQVYTIHKPS